MAPDETAPRLARFVSMRSRLVHKFDDQSLKGFPGLVRFDRSRLVASEEAPEEPIYISGPEI